jgi:hypothetical protein
MQIIEYRKHLINGQIRDPDFITNGGNWYSSSDDTYIAVMADNLPYYLPDTLTILTQAELINRVKQIHLTKPFGKRTGVLGSGGVEHPTDLMSDSDIEDMVTEWLKGK